MKLNLMDILVCPLCKAVLKARFDAGVSEIREGSVQCSVCHAHYRITDGIASFVEPAALTDSPAANPSFDVQIQKKEQLFRDANWSNYENVVSSYTNYPEIQIFVKEISLTKNEKLLEVGAGTGRMTRAFAGLCKEAVCIDFSINNLKYLRKKMAGPVENIHVAHADASKLPFKDRCFDKVASAQVFQSLPQDVLHSALKEVRRVLKPGGSFVFSIYNYSIVKRLKAVSHPQIAEDKGWLKKGTHAKTIYYQNFTPQELRGLLNPYFKVQKIYGALTPFTGRVRGLGNAVDSCLPTIVKTPLSQLLMAHCINK
jgi:ubiquinone/menaquinone biosynthesis C-methylase UbiE/uncharacterized protein YbaR (Trm112 family)